MIAHERVEITAYTINKPVSSFSSLCSETRVSGSRAMEVAGGVGPVCSIDQSVLSHLVCAKKKIQKTFNILLSLLYCGRN